MSKRLVLAHSLDSSALESLGEHRKDARVERRLIALRQLGLGRTAEEAAETVGVSERTIRQWVAEFNEEGASSLCYGRYKGRISHLTPKQEEELAEVIRKGPPPEMKIEVWRAWAPRQWTQERFGAANVRQLSVRWDISGRIFSALFARWRHVAWSSASLCGFGGHACVPCRLLQVPVSGDTCDSRLRPGRVAYFRPLSRAVERDSVAFANEVSGTNPPELLWREMRQKHLGNRVFPDVESMYDAVSTAWMHVIENPQSV